MDRSISWKIRFMIEQLLPHFVIAGKTAMRIQDLLKSVPQAVEQKSGSRFISALTDADGALQTYLATVLLALFPEVQFEGEEQDAISKYFPSQAPIAVTLDPVNGTLFYKDGRPIFDIIMTFRYEGQLVGAVIYLPRFEKFYVGIEGMGGFTTTPARIEKETIILESYQLPAAKPIIFGSSMSDELLGRLETIGLPIIDLSREYRSDGEWHLTPTSLLSAGIAAIVKPNSAMIDWGAVSFIARMAGGTESDNTGKALPQYDQKTLRAPWMVVAQNHELHERIITALNH